MRKAIILFPLMAKSYYLLHLIYPVQSCSELEMNPLDRMYCYFGLFFLTTIFI